MTHDRRWGVRLRHPHLRAPGRGDSVPAREVPRSRDPADQERQRRRRRLAGDRLATFTSEEGMGFENAYRPGSLRRDAQSRWGRAIPTRSYEPEPMRPEYVEREPRLERARRSGRGALRRSSRARSLCRPSTTSPTPMRSTRTCRRTIAGTTRPGASTTRTGSTRPRCCRFRDLDRAVALTDEVLGRGARVVLLPTGPAYGRSPGDPYFDPVWARLNEAGVVVALHIMPFWYFDAMSPAWGHDADPNVVAHVGVAVDEHLRRAPGHRHHLGADLRQPLRALPEAQRACRRARRQLGSSHVSITWTRAGAWAATGRGSAGR